LIAAAAIVVVLIAAGVAVTKSHLAQAAPRCGTVIEGPGPGSGDPRPLNCLYEAFIEGRLTEARTVRRTTEGDPITYDLKIVLASKRIEVNVDSKDRFGSKGKFHYVCEGIEKVADSRYPARRIELTGCWGEPGFISQGRIAP
jgi:hypothetical protein